MLILASFWDRFCNPFWLVLGSTFGALGGGQKVTRMTSKIYAEIGIEKSRFQGRPGTKQIPGLVARRDSPPFRVRGDVNLAPGGRQFGRKEEKKKGRKKKMNIWRF